MTDKNANYAVVFPGQGSQSLGMLDDWRSHQALVDEVLDEANEALGFDLGKVVSEGPVEKLNQTSITQPAMLTAGVIAWKIWLKSCVEKNISRPTVLAGHSLGEYTALVAAEVLNFSDALRLVEYRGQCMQDAVSDGEGAMAAILGLDDDKVVEACKLASTEGIVEAVNFNAPGQVVVAGEANAVEVAIELVKEAGARRAIKLPVSVPSHCQLMIPAAKRLEDHLESVTLSEPKLAVIHNVDVSRHTSPTDIRKILVEQLHKPVRWVECIQKIKGEDVSMIIECGPGKVLSGLQRRIDREVNAFPVFSDNTLIKTLNAFSDK